MDIPGRLFNRGEEVLSDWFPRGGDGIIVRVEAIARGNLDIQVEVWTKNSEDTGQGAAISGWTVTAGDPSLVGLFGELIKIADASPGTTGMKELVRLKITTTGGASPQEGWDWVLARIFPPIFFDASR